MLTIHHDSKGFFKIKVDSASRYYSVELRGIINDINDSWSDIERLNYIFHKFFSELSDNDEKISFNMDLLLTITKSFYIHLDIINKSLERIEKMNLGAPSRLIKLNRKKRFLQHISIVRNNIIVHKEKADFVRPSGVMSATDPKVLYEHVLVTLDSNGNKKAYPLRPLKHAEMMNKLLANLERLL